MLTPENVQAVLAHGPAKTRPKKTAERGKSKPHYIESFIQMCEYVGVCLPTLTGGGKEAWLFITLADTI